MKKTIFAIVLGAASTSVFAQQNYTQAAIKDTLCRDVADDAELGYASRATHQHHEIFDLGTNDYAAAIKTWAFNYGRDTAASDEDARKVGYAKCWDKLDEAAMREHEHQKYMTLEEVND